MTGFEDQKGRPWGWYLVGLLSGAGIAYATVRLVDELRGVLKHPRYQINTLEFPSDKSEITEQAYRIAAGNLLSGVEKRRLAGGEERLVLNAGARNFREPWARDFGFASFGLLALGEHRILRECLDAFLLTQSPDGQFPVKIYSTSVARRYLHSILQREQPSTASLRPKYITGHGTIALDGNALLIIALLNYVAQTGDSEFLSINWDNLIRAIRWLTSYADPGDGLLHQEAYSDWADTIARQGRVLYTNVLYWKAMQELGAAAESYGFVDDEAWISLRTNRLADAIQAYFWRPQLGYFVTSQEFTNLNASGNLLAVAWGLASDEQAISILEKMDAFGMADPVPTRPVQYGYPRRYIAIENRMGGLAYYHTEAAWLWLGAWHSLANFRAGRLAEAHALLARMSDVIVRDGVVHEVYRPDGNPVRGRLYSSEAPLTWSAGMFVYAYAVVQQQFSLVKHRTGQEHNS